MKTNLNRIIESEADAKEFIRDLVNNNEWFPLGINAHLLYWKESTTTPKEKDKINKLSSDCYNYLINPNSYLVQYVELKKYVKNEN